ncbi:MAG: metalloregulator ArsR/SmtB family transcription factor [Erysipelotrichaceae bacterium]|nr:metalloregulator ArsR/SmtB family transcription factor [Erysipelotrichaceae bacterium]
MDHYADLPYEKILLILKAIDNQKRLMILYALKHQAMTVNELAVLSHASPSLTSHNLRILKDNRLVKSSIQGRYIYYSLDDEHVAHFLLDIVEHIKEVSHD